jgi:hypothetical protein
MIDDSLLKFLPAYTPSRVVPIRTAENPKFYDHLLAEAGLTELGPYILDLKKVMKEDSTKQSEFIRFLKYRGTVASVELILSWIGFDRITFVRLSTTEYEIGLTTTPTQIQIKAIQIASRLSTPGRGQLKRIFNGTNFEVKFG